MNTPGITPVIPNLSEHAWNYARNFLDATHIVVAVAVGVGHVVDHVLHLVDHGVEAGKLALIGFAVGLISP